MTPLHELETTTWPAPIHTSVWKKSWSANEKIFLYIFFPHTNPPHGQITNPIYEESEISYAITSSYLQHQYNVQGKLFIKQNPGFSGLSHSKCTSLMPQIFHIIDVTVFTHYFYLFPSQVEKVTPREVYQPILFCAQRTCYSVNVVYLDFVGLTKRQHKQKHNGENITLKILKMSNTNKKKHDH